MLIALDPDIFTVALDGGDSSGKQKCLNTILWILSEPEARIILDVSQILFREFIDLLDAHHDDTRSDFVLKLLESIVSENNVYRGHLNNDQALVELIRQKGCTHLVEPLLIKLGAGIPAHALFVMIVPGPGAQKRPRGVHDKRIRADIERHLNSACPKNDERKRIIYAEENVPSFPVLAPPVKTNRARWFEDKVRVVLHPLLGCDHVFPRSPKFLGNEEVDFYGYKTSGEPRPIWVGECKLREHSLSEEIHLKEIEQLERKRDAIAVYASGDPAIRGSVEVKSFLISNAPDLDDEATQQAGELDATFYRAVLSKDWQTSEQWDIDAIEEYTFIREETGVFRRELVRRISTRT